MSAPAALPLPRALRLWLRVAALSFGGPAAQIAVMHRLAVDEERVVDEERFLHATQLCMLLPGPEAQQLATWLGWRTHGVAGGLVSGGLFILPGFVSILLLSFAWLRWGALPALQGLTLGLQAAAVALVLHAAERLGRKVLKGRLQRLLAGAALLSLLAGLPFPALVLAAGLLGAARPGWLGVTARAGAPAGDRGAGLRASGWALAVGLPLWLGPLALLGRWLGPDHALPQLGAFFSGVALLTFGGAYSVLGHVAEVAVHQRGWLSPAEMAVGLGLAESTPGPLIQVVQYVGTLAAFRAPGGLDPWAAALGGALVSAWATFAPCFVWIFAFAPQLERLRHSRRLSGALAAISAAVVGVIAQLGLRMGAALLQPEAPAVTAAAGLLAAAAALALRRGVGVGPVLGGAALVGIALGAAAGAPPAG
jgi:chromate transporter